MTRLRRLSRQELGAAMIELAMVSVVLFMFIGGILDLCLISLGATAGPSAARDGARVGVLSYFNADLANGATCLNLAAGSANYQVVANATLRNLSHAAVIDASCVIAVRCLDGMGTDPTYPSAATKACDAGIVPDTDLIEVKVTWRQLGTSQFVGAQTHSDFARMIILGLPIIAGTTTTIPTTTTVPPTTTTTAPGPTTTLPPTTTTVPPTTTTVSPTTTTVPPTTTTTAPPACAFVSAAVTPNPSSVDQGSDKLGSDLTVTLTTSGPCSTLTATVPPGSGPDQVATLTGGPTAWTGSISNATPHLWTAGTKTATIAANGVTIGTTTFTVQ